MIKALWFHDGESGYQVGKYGVISIIEFDYKGSMAYYPWFRVDMENGDVKELNSMFVEEVVYKKESSDSTSEERGEIDTEKTDNQAGKG